MRVKLDAYINKQTKNKIELLSKKHNLSLGGVIDLLFEDEVVEEKIIDIDPKIEEIYNKLKENYNVCELNDLLSYSRKHEIIFWREVMSVYLYTYYGCGVSEIGRITGKEHATIINHLSKVSDMIKYEPKSHQGKILVELFGKFYYKRDYSRGGQEW